MLSSYICSIEMLTQCYIMLNSSIHFLIIKFQQSFKSKISYYPYGKIIQHLLKFPKFGSSLKPKLLFHKCVQPNKEEIDTLHSNIQSSELQIL